MEIAARVSGGVDILDLKGRLVLDDGDIVFRRQVDALIQEGHRRILLNFAEVTDLDSTGVGVVVWKYITLQRQGGALKLERLNTRCHRILRTARLLTVLATFDSEAEAIDSFQ